MATQVDTTQIYLSILAKRKVAKAAASDFDLRQLLGHCSLLDYLEALESPPTSPTGSPSMTTTKETEQVDLTDITCAKVIETASLVTVAELEISDSWDD